MHSCKIADWCLRHPQKPKQYEHEFGVCVVVSYGRMHQDQMTSMIEWFEFHRLLGVTEFNIYNASLRLDRTMRQVFNYYEKANLLNVVQHPAPFRSESRNECANDARDNSRDKNGDDVYEDAKNASYTGVSCDDAHKLLVYSSLNDCLYRNIYRYENLITIDVDEIIIPVTFHNYSQLIDYYIDSNNSHQLEHSLKFQSRSYYIKDYAVDANQPENLPSMRHRVYSYDKSRPKMLHNPRLCTLMFQHACIHTRHVKVPMDDVASVHHYRATCASGDAAKPRVKQRCRQQAESTSVDDNVLMFKHRLSTRVQRAHSDIQHLL